VFGVVAGCDVFGDPHQLEPDQLEPALLQARQDRPDQSALDAVGLGERAGAFPNELSGGQQQRVAIARAVVTQPPLVIADEPTGNLDLETAWQVMKLLEQIARFGTTVLIATHNLDIVRRMQRRVLTLVDGRLVRDQPAGRVGRLAWASS